MKKKYYSRSRRIRKAYWTTFIILMGYLRLKWVSRIRGKKYYSKKIKAQNLKSALLTRETILELEGLFIKVGQLLSILTNFLPEEYHEPLNSLQNQLPPRPYSEIKQRIQSEFGKSVDELFSDFDKNALATASIGQAHIAHLKDGTKVIVKVQHYNIEKIADVDLQIIERLTNLAGWFFDIKGIEYAYQQIKEMIEDELDFEKEAESMQIIAKNLSEVERFIIPEVHKEVSSGRVLVSTFCEGVKISDLQQLNEWEVDKTDIARRLVAVYVEMALRNGFYHADPHPGNILIQQDGTIVLLDFGAVATVQPSFRKGIPRLVEAIAVNDTNATIEALKRMDFISDNKDATRIAEKLINTARFFIQEEVKLKGLDFKNLQNINVLDNSIFRLTTEVGLKKLVNTVQVPKDYVLLNRTATLLLGICSALDHTLNPLDELRPHVQQLILEEKGDLIDVLYNSLQGTVQSLLAIPNDLHKVLQQAEKGQLEININGTSERTQMIFSLAQQMIFTLLMITGVIIGLWLRKDGDVEFSQYSFGASGLFLILMWRAMRRARKKSKF